MGQPSPVGKAWGLLALLFVALWGMLALGLHRNFTSRRALVIWDFAPLWHGAQVLFREDGSPYDREVAARVMQESYGRPARSGEDSRAFSYPLYALYLVAPLFWMSRPWAQAVWLATLLAAFLVGSMAVWRVWQRPVRGWQAGAFLVGLLFLYPVTWALLLGQMAVWVFAWVALSLWALERGRDRWAGGFLALSTVKPHLVALLVPVTLLWSARRRRWGVWQGFGLVEGTLVGTSWMLLPRWPVAFLQAVQRYAESRPFVSPWRMVLEGSLPQDLASVVYLGSVAVLGLGWLVAVGRMPHPRAWPWVAAFTLVLTFFLVPRAHVADQVVLVYPLWGWFWSTPGSARFRGLVRGGFLALGVGYWVFHNYWLVNVPRPAPVVEMLQHRALSPLLPGLLLGLGLYIGFLQMRTKAMDRGRPQKGEA